MDRDLAEGEVDTGFEIDRVISHSSICLATWIGACLTGWVALTHAQPARRVACGELVNGVPAYLQGKNILQTATERPYQVLDTFPHDPGAFTEGLIFHEGYLYESTGLHGRSSLRKVQPESGRVIHSQSLSPMLFGEGLTLWNGRLLQLTWKSGRAFFYRLSDLSKTDSFRYVGEGWGCTVVNGLLVVSDGSSRLRFLEPEAHRNVATIQVTDGGRPVEGLNELERVGDSIFANVFPTNCVAEIDSGTGHVRAWLDLSRLVPIPIRRNRSAVANGIAYDPRTGTLLVTGKHWPMLFRLKLLKKTQHIGQQTRVQNCKEMRSC